MSDSRQQAYSATDAAALAAELLLELESRQSSLEEDFCRFLLMEVFVRKFRALGMSNADILALCQRIGQQNE